MKRYTDKERLDWLQNHGQPISVEVTVDNRREWFCWYDVMKEPHHSRTIRGAIDAAMRRDKGGKNG
jgi:hypothetical protein